MDRLIKFRTPMKCKNGHFDWMETEIFHGLHRSLVRGNAIISMCGCGEVRTAFGQSEQFTGLLDRNGKEIYEADICWVHYHHGFTFKGDVKYDNGNACWQIGMDSIYDSTAAQQGNTIEVLGNIHEPAKKDGSPSTP
jgi:hypothetical protein